MSYLLDTQVFLWYLSNDNKLKDSVKKIIVDPRNNIYVSVASAWEISIKHNIGKLTLKTTLKKCFEISNFPVLNISIEHILDLENLPLLHRDPFDRIIIAQSRVENLTLISSDPKIWRYKINSLKA